jgi:hypothetical protein
MVAWRTFGVKTLARLPIKPELLPIEDKPPSWDGSYPAMVATLEAPMPGN